MDNLMNTETKLITTISRFLKKSTKKQILETFNTQNRNKFI